MNNHQTSVLQLPIHPLNIFLTLAMHPNYVVYQQMPLLHLFQHIQALYQNQRGAIKQKNFVLFTFFFIKFNLHTSLIKSVTSYTRSRITIQQSVSVQCADTSLSVNCFSFGN